MWVAVLGGIVLVYCLLSWVLLRFPLLFWRPVAPSLGFRVQHVGHRGGGGDHPENTLKAFRAAWQEHAVDCLELDVRRTKDRVVVISHDADLSRVCGHASFVQDMRYDELPRVHGEPFCRLADLLDDQSCQRAPICLDFKVDDPSLVDEVYDMFAVRKRLHLLVWGSFSESVRRYCRVRYPHVPTYMSLLQSMWVYVAFLLGFLPFMSLDSCLLATVLIRDEWVDQFVRLPHPFPLSLVARILWWFGPPVFAWLIEHPLLVRHLQRRGISVVFWTANSEEDLLRVSRSGASGIVTDFPSKKLHRLLKRVGGNEI